MSEPTALAFGDDWLAEMRARAEAHEAHRAACTATPCAECCRALCPDCGATVNYHKAMRCDPCDRKADRVRRLEAARESVPQRFAWARLEDPRMVKLVGHERIAEARLALAQERVVLAGAPGAGKTSLACAMLRELHDSAARDDAPEALVRRAAGSLFVSAYDLSKARARHPLGQGEAPLVERAMNATTLVIDDLGSERDGFQSAVTEVLYERHAECRVTWVTTWLDVRQAEERYGGGIARRLFEGARRIALGKVK